MTNAHGRSGARRPREGGAARKTTLTVIAAIVVALLAIGGVAALLRGGDDDGGTAAATNDPSAGLSPSATESTPSAPTVTTPATGSSNAAAPTGSKSVRTYHGTGNKVVKIKKPGNSTDPVLVQATYAGPSNFSLFALDAGSYESQILVNVKGSYHGTTLLDPQGAPTRHLKVRASGPWTLTIKPVSAAKTMSTRAKGTSDDVVLYTGSGGLADVSHLGKLNFVVKYYRDGDEVRLLNNAGEFHGQLQMPKGTRLIEITADGKWTINVNP